MNCLAPTEDTAYFMSPRLPLPDDRVYAVVGALGTQTGNATYVGLGLNSSLTQLGFDNIDDDKLAGIRERITMCPTTISSSSSISPGTARAKLEALTAGSHCYSIGDQLPDCYDPADPTCAMLGLSVRNYLLPGSQRGPAPELTLSPRFIPLQIEPETPNRLWFPLILLWNRSCPTGSGGDRPIDTRKRGTCTRGDTKMKPLTKPLTIEPAGPIPPSITTPDKVESRIGTLEFTDGMPSPETLDKVYDHLDFTHAFEAFVNTVQGVGFQATHMGLLDAGVKDNEVLIFSELMDAKTLLLAANADTVYAIGLPRPHRGPMVLEVPPKFLGAIDDGWGRWVTDFGGPGPDRGLGGKYLILPPGYDGPLPEGGFFTARAGPRTSSGWAACSWRTTVRSRPSSRSASSSRSTPTRPVGPARPSPRSSAARLNSDRSRRRPRPSSTTSAAW